MANVNALIAQGGNVLGNQATIQNIKTSMTRNSLLDIAVQNEPARQERLQSQEQRLQAQSQRLQAAEDRAQSGFDTIEGLRQGISLMRFLDNDAPDIQGAIDFVSQGGVTEKEQPVIDMLQNGQIEALTTGTRGLIETALLVGDIKQPKGVTPRNPIAGTDASGNPVFFTTGAGNVPQVIPGITPPVGTDEGQTRDERAIASGMRQGLTQAQSENLVFGRTRQEINESTGQIVKIEDIAGQVTEIPVSGGTEETPTPPVGQTLMDLADTASGPVASITAKTAAALSFFGIDTDEAATGAQQTFNTHTTALIRALSINPRFPVAEMERIQKEVNIKPSFLQGASTLKKKIRSLDGSLRLRLDQAERDFNDPNLDVKTRQAQGANASALKNFLAILGGNQEGDPVADEIAQLEEELGIR